MEKEKKYMAEVPVSHWVGVDCPGAPSVWGRRRVRLADAEGQVCSVSGHLMSVGRDRIPPVSSLSAPVFLGKCTTEGWALWGQDFISSTI